MIRFAAALTCLVLLTLVLLPLQWLGIALKLPLQRRVPHLYHRSFCALAGVRVRQVGRRSENAPVLILSNHVSWLDIAVIGSLAPVVFIAKSEVAGWPVFGFLARMQRTIFIERERRHKTGAAAQEIAGRLRGGDAVVLFAEGTSSDGLRVLPFRSSLVGAVHQTLDDSAQHQAITVQPMSVAYTRFAGLPIGRGLRDHVAWYGDADLMPHFIGILAAGATDVTVTWGDVDVCAATANRKAITRAAETAVRRMTVAALRG